MLLIRSIKNKSKKLIDTTQAWNGVNREFSSFKSFELTRAYADTYIKQVTCQIKALTEQQDRSCHLLKHNCLCVWNRKRERKVIQLDLEELGVEEGQEPGVKDDTVENILNSWWKFFKVATLKSWLNVCLVLTRASSYIDLSIWIEVNER